MGRDPLLIIGFRPIFAIRLLLYPQLWALENPDGPVQTTVVVPVHGTIMEAEIDFMSRRSLDHGMEAASLTTHHRDGSRTFPAIDSIVQIDLVCATFLEETIIVYGYVLIAIGITRLYSDSVD